METQFPKQLIAESKKDKEWHKKNVDAILRQSRSTANTIFLTERKKDYENFQIVNGNFDPKQFEYITDMYGVTAPARFVNYPILMPRLDSLIGEFMSQPLAFDVEVINRDAVNKKIEKKVAVAAEVLLRPIRKEIEKTLGMEFPAEEIGEEIPEDIDAFMKTPIRLSIESTIHNSLEYIIAKHNIKGTFKRGLYDMFITGKSFYYVHIKNGDPFVERVDPRSMIWDGDPDLENIKDGKYAAYETFMTVNEILDTYRADLSKDDVIEIEKMQQQPHDYINSNPEYTGYYRYSQGENTLKVKVTIAQWKSIRMVRFKESPNKFDPENPYLKMVDDKYKPKKNEKIVSKPYTDVRKATLIGHKFLVDWGRKENQVRYESNYAETSLDFFGAIKGNFNGTTLSLVDATKNIQIMYNVVMFHINLALSRAGGKSIVYDTSQKPKNIPLEDVFYHAKNSGLILINSAQEGALQSRFNQFQQVDFTLSNSVQQMINLKMMLEDTMEQLTGISRQRMGITKTSDAVGVNQQSVMQSNLVTQPYFELHIEIISDVLNCLANKFRLAWGNEKRVATFLGDTGFKTLEITEELLGEMGVFVKNSMKEVQNKQVMLSLVERAVSSGGVDLDLLVKSINASTAGEVETILSQGVEAMREQQQALEQQKVQVQQQANEIEAQKIQVPVQVAQINKERDITVAEINNQTKERIAEGDQENKRDLAEHSRKTDLDNKMMDSTTEEENPYLGSKPQPFARNNSEKSALKNRQENQKKDSKSAKTKK